MVKKGVKQKENILKLFCSIFIDMNKINWTVDQMDNLIVQYFFQLVRTENLENIEQRLNFLLYKIKKIMLRILKI